MINKLISIVGESNVFPDEPMKNHTTFKVGGKADFVVMPENEEQLLTVLRLAKSENVPVTVVGNGSNLLVGDGGIRGIVILISRKMSNVTFDETAVTAQSGILLSQLAAKIAAKSLTGFEFASGIPGSLGGAAAMNAGAYGEEMSGVISDITYVDAENGVKTISAKDCNFGYRRTFFTGTDYIITKCTLKLKRGNPDEIRAKTEELRSRRLSKQPLDKPSAGSTFKRPEGYFAGALIQQANLKGFSIGGAKISEKHAGFIINDGGATAADILKLVKYTQKTVEEKFGVRLEPEVKIIGDF